MNVHDIIFTLNSEEKIIIELEIPIENIHCCSEAPIVFCKKKHMYLLQKDSIRFNIECLKSLLDMALTNRLQLDKSITKDIGYLYSEKLQNKSNLNLIYEKIDNQKWWIGERYSLWYGDFPTWIYNDAEGKIIFEMTPYFPGKPTYLHLDEPLTPEEIANSAWYDQWIKNYKPILMRIIPREIAEEWLDQANFILKTIEENSKRRQDEKRF